MFEKEKVKGIIMDLRGNPGGLYEQAQKVADAFIESGTLVSMVGVGGAQRKDETATKSDHEPKVPVAVLVNQNSASASEIVAGAHEEPRPRRGHRRGDLRQGVGAGAVRHPVAHLVRRQVGGRQARAQADHRAVPDPGRHLDPGRRRHSRHRDRPAAGAEGRRAVVDPAAAVEPQAARGRLRVAPRAPERAARREAARDRLVPVHAQAQRQARARRRRRRRGRRPRRPTTSRRRTPTSRTTSSWTSRATSWPRPRASAAASRSAPPRPSSTRCAPTRTRS